MKVCFLGTGNIAQAHAQALSTISGVELAGVFDLNQTAAEAFSKQYKASKVYSSIDEVLADPAIDCVHILTPPDSHADLVTQFAKAGKRVFVEKPIVTTAAQFDTFAQLPELVKSNICVNQNSCFHPSFEAIAKAIELGKIGKARYIECTFEPFLKQFAASQFTHWMFASPLNLLLEQAVHPLAQIVAIANSTNTQHLVVMPGRSISVSATNAFVPSLTAAFEQGSIPVTFRMRVGASFPVWQLKVVGDDGYVLADMISGTYEICGRTKYLEAGDNLITQSRIAVSHLHQSLSAFKNYCFAQAGLKSRNDSFFLGMKGSIKAFYESIANKSTFLANANFGCSLVKLCQEIALKLPVQSPATQHISIQGKQSQLITVFGATGFIGKRVVEDLIASGFKVRAVARGVRNLGAPFDHQSVELVRADIKNSSDVLKAIQGSSVVINLAHGGGGSNYEAIRAAMVDSALAIAKACEQSEIPKLVHVGSIASLYLGNASETITDATAPDPDRVKRGDYARAKAECDDSLEAYASKSKLQIINLRPGLVVGKGTSPLHSGIGFFNNEQHIIGWNEGNNPLPFVLVSDVSTAIEKCLTTGLQKKYYAFNLVGDYRPTAKQYVELLKTDLQRPLVYHPSSVNGLLGVDIGKWVIKKIAGKKAPFPPKRDLLSRGLKANFDCTNAKNELGWQPVDDEKAFREQATKVHV